jgi:putative radical SAM enzyme (TIGR03279 family)
MRETVYFKDDDAKLSYTQGTYITLTNLTNTDLFSIINGKIPVNVSVHTLNPELRVRMMKNPMAGESLSKLFKMAESGVPLNCSIVLCKGYNDGAELEKTFEVLSKYDSIKSISAVPVGLTKHRENLVQLEPFSREDAAEVVRLSERYAKCYASDEFYLLAGIEIPDEEYYAGYPQFENGVGMVRSFIDEYDGRFTDCSVVTGELFAPILRELVGDDVDVFAVRNEFYGRSITVAGLLTGADVVMQLRGKVVREPLYLPSEMFNVDGLTLDGMTAREIGERLALTTTPLTTA